MKGKKIWFKAKEYGWGWYPCTWQGWMIILFFIGLVICAARVFLTKGKLVEYFVSLIVIAVILIYVAYKKGEKPGWHWGNKIKHVRTS